MPRRPAAPPVDEGRDAFLDVVRAISIVRVMFWHALGFWWISWTFAAMPAVFYVAGAVLAKSLRKASCWTVVKARLRRLIPPYLAFVGIAMAAILLADPAAWSNQTANIVSWFVPYRAPAPIAWEEGWLSTPLWFLRALVVVLLLTPLLRPLGQRLPGRLMFGAWIGSLFVLDSWVDHQSSELSTGIVRGSLTWCASAGSSRSGRVPITCATGCHGIGVGYSPWSAWLRRAHGRTWRHPSTG